MILSEFIRNNNPQIIAEWEAFAKTRRPAADSMTKLQLQDHIEEILDFIAEDIDLAQTSAEQKAKSFGNHDNTQQHIDSAAETHGRLRHGSGFDIVQMVSEYRALRSSIIRLWTDKKGVLKDKDVLDLTRLNESIDQALAESVVKFMEKVEYSKDLLLGVLGHDIRSPLGAITMSAHLIPRVGALNKKQDLLLEQICSSSTRVTGIVSDLLDLTRTRMGSALPISRNSMDIGVLAQEIIDEMNIQYPDQTIHLEKTGKLIGEWDSRRLGQVFSNLIGNAIQYGAKNTPINLKIKGLAKEVVISVQNEGTPIPNSTLKTIFNSFSSGNAKNSNEANTNLGLGLFITKEIINSHCGKLSVISNKKDGTIFTAKLPFEL